MPLYRRQVVKPTADLGAVGYIGINNITNVSQQNAINDFALGLKTLGIYSTSVFYPLRSSQSIASGTTAYSCGGLGTYNATISTTPTWGSNGISFSGGGTLRNDSLATVIRSANAYSTILICSNAATGTINFGVLKGGGSNQTGDNYTAFARQFNFFSQSQIYLTGGDNTRNFGSLSFSSSGFQFFGSTRNGLSAPSTNTGSVILNGTTNSSLSGTGNLPSTNPFSDNFYLFGAGATGNEFSFVMITTSALSSANMQSVRSLYISTLGIGLGLP
jgi:hypothetical protein